MQFHVFGRGACSSNLAKCTRKFAYRQLIIEDMHDYFSVQVLELKSEEMIQLP